MYSIIATINIDPERIEEFKEASFSDATGSVRDEPQCFRFDIHQDATNPARFHLHEVYRDETAFEAHCKTPHFLKWLGTVQAWFDGDPQVTVMNTVFPSDAGWEKQQPGLLDW
jgi:autoinducer 2-degrading protein